MANLHIDSSITIPVSIVMSPLNLLKLFLSFAATELILASIIGRNYLYKILLLIVDISLILF